VRLGRLEHTHTRDMEASGEEVFSLLTATAAV